MARAPKVTVHPTSVTQELVAAAAASFVVKSSAGLAITLRKPNPLAQFRLVRMLGEAADNRSYVGMVLPLLFVVSIDGEPVAFPNKESEIEALIMRLDDDGLTAVMNGVQEHWGVDTEVDAAALKK